MRSQKALASALISSCTTELSLGTSAILAATKEGISTLSTDRDDRSSLASLPVNKTARSQDEEDATAPQTEPAKMYKEGNCFRWRTQKGSGASHSAASERRKNATSSIMA